jgi:hypothetical protein
MAQLSKALWLPKNLIKAFDRLQPGDAWQGLSQ